MFSKEMRQSAVISAWWRILLWLFAYTSLCAKSGTSQYDNIFPDRMKKRFFHMRKRLNPFFIM